MRMTSYNKILTSKYLPWDEKKWEIDLHSELNCYCVWFKLPDRWEQFSIHPTRRRAEEMLAALRDEAGQTLWDDMYNAEQ